MSVEQECHRIHMCQMEYNKNTIYVSDCKSCYGYAFMIVCAWKIVINDATSSFYVKINRDFKPFALLLIQNFFLQLESSEWKAMLMLPTFEGSFCNEWQYLHKLFKRFLSNFRKNRNTKNIEYRVSTHLNYQYLCSTSDQITTFHFSVFVLILD